MRPLSFCVCKHVTILREVPRLERVTDLGEPRQLQTGILEKATHGSEPSKLRTDIVRPKPNDMPLKIMK